MADTAGAHQPDPSQWLTTREVARELRIDDESVRRWIRDRHIGAVKVGRSWRVNTSDLNAFLGRHHNGADL